MAILLLQSHKCWDYGHESTPPSLLSIFRHVTRGHGYLFQVLCYVKAFKGGFTLLGSEGGNNSAGKVEALQWPGGRERTEERGRTCFLPQRPGKQGSAFSHWKQGGFKGKEYEVRGVKICVAVGGQKPLA